MEALVMSGRLIIRKKQLEKEDLELQGEKD